MLVGERVNVEESARVWRRDRGDWGWCGVEGVGGES